MAKYFIEVEKGGRFEIELDEAAPATAAAFRAFMEKNDGYEAHCLQGRFSGEEMYFSAPLGSTEQEKQYQTFHRRRLFQSRSRLVRSLPFTGENISQIKNIITTFLAI